MSRRIKIGFVHRFDARDVRSWSGTLYSMAKALEAHAGEVVYLGPDKSSATEFIVRTGYRIDRLLFKLTRKHWIMEHNRILSWQMGRFFKRRIEENPCDIVFAPAASIEVASLDINVPIVYLSDITWADILDYYSHFSSLSGFARAEGGRIEAAAIGRAAAIVYPSEWAVRSACQNYGANPETTYKISFGANLAHVPSREKALDHSLNGPIKLLMVGVDWERKGGAIAFDCLTNLLARGVDAQLTICGCVPPAGYEHPRLQVIPFLDKNDPVQQQRLSQLFLESNFLLFPTRADATPIATCEASAHGLPTLITDTGGTRGAIVDGVNGFLLPMEAGGPEYAEVILRTIADVARYRELVTGSRDQFEQSLNWDVWGKAVCGVMERVLERKLDRSPAVSNIVLNTVDSAT
jgi:glycosyltransferase involved in cell wall biosynthesis